SGPAAEGRARSNIRAAALRPNDGATADMRLSFDRHLVDLAGEQYVPLIGSCPAYRIGLGLRSHTRTRASGPPEAPRLPSAEKAMKKPPESPRTTPLPCPPMRPQT